MQQLAKLNNFVRESGDILHADKGVAYIGDLLCICKSIFFHELSVNDEISRNSVQTADKCWQSDMEANVQQILRQTDNSYKEGNTLIYCNSYRIHKKAWAI